MFSCGFQTLPSPHSPKFARASLVFFHQRQYTPGVDCPRGEVVSRSLESLAVSRKVSMLPTYTIAFVIFTVVIHLSPVVAHILGKEKFNWYDMALK